MWRDEVDYQPDRIRRQQAKPVTIGADRQAAAVV
jgi:hypothetical protein